MNNSILNRLASNRAVIALCGILSLLGVTESADAGCITGAADPSAFSLLIDASSSCGNLNNMYGCEIGASGTCTIVNPNTGETINVSLANGAVGGTTPIDWVSTSPSGKMPDFVILLGATAGGTCGFNYAPGSDFGAGLIFEKSNNTNQKVGGIEVCSDFIQPPPEEPRLILRKTVSKTVSADPVADCASAQDLVEASLGDQVRYCYTVENVGIGLAENVTLKDDEGTPGSTVGVPLTGLNNDGSLNSGATATGTMLVTLLEAGRLVNTATAEAYGLGGTVVVTSTDTATVDTLLTAEICPENYQDAVNQLSLETGLDFAFLLDPNQTSRRAVCVPNGENGSADTIRVSCINQCIVKPGCEIDPEDNPDCSPSVCEESGAWTSWNDPYSCTVIEDRPEGVQPYCWEVQQDLTRDCELNSVEVQETGILTVDKIHTNPYVYQSCYTSGGREVCETMCFAYSNKDAKKCPPDSTVVR
jgi:hypothetical protein